MFWQMIVSGLAMGCIYALIALGFILIYKATEVVNFAQGDIMMVGAFIAYTALILYDIPYPLAILATVAFMALFGMIVERVVLRPLIGEPVFVMIMVTLALGILLRSGAGMIWGYDTYRFRAGMTETTVRFSGISISSSHLAIMAVTIILIAALYFFFNRTRMGISIEATSQNQLAAFLMGISVKKVFSNIWAIAAVVAAIAGVLLSPIQFLNYNMGYIGLKAFPAAVLGGFGSVPGAIVGGIIIGVSESLAGFYLPGGYKESTAWVILIIVLMIRPEGIFGTQQQTRV